MTAYAETNGFAEYADSAHKLLSDNRELYITMSKMTRNGRVPTVQETRVEQERRRIASADPAQMGRAA